MDVTTIDHVEFYVGDAERTARFLCDAFGFRCVGQGGPGTGLADQRSLLLRQGGIRLLVTAGGTAAHPVARHVQRHGDGVARLALRTGDAAAAYHRAVRRGALAVAEPRDWGRDGAVRTATVGGPGALAHTLVERHGPADEFLPGGIEMLPPEPDPGDDRLDTVDHAALCVPAGQLAATVHFYEDVFGLRDIFRERVEVGDQAMDSTVVQSPSRAITLTIVAPDPTRRTGQLDDFLRANGGAGVQHLALRTADITAAVAVLGGRGVRFLRTPDSYYDAIEGRLGHIGRSVQALRDGGILVDRDHWGELFQIFTEAPFERRTFFFEVIERHGAQTFGSNNIKALYEAKERSRAGADV